MLKFENTAEVGDLIKAFDFQPMSDRPDSFLVGHVIAKGTDHSIGGHNVRFGAYTVKVIHRVFAGEIVHDCQDEVFVPFETSFTEHDERVTVV
jgi:hypothetical protein